MALGFCGVLLLHPLARWDWRFFDQTLRWRLAWSKAPPFDPRICYLEITDEDRDALRSVGEEYAAFASLIQEAADLGAKLVVLDVILQQAREVDGQPLLEAIQSNRQVVLAEAWLGEGAPANSPQRKRSLPFGPRLTPAGLINVTPDPDGVMRHYRYWFAGKDGWEPSLSLAAFLTLQGLSGPQALQTNSAGELEWEELSQDNVHLFKRTLNGKLSVLNHRCGWTNTGYASARHWSLGKLHQAHREWLAVRGAAPGASWPLAGTILLVGYTATGVVDLGATPFGAREPLITLHATALSDLLQNRQLHALPAWTDALYGILAAGFGGLGSLGHRKRMLTLWWGVGLLAWTGLSFSLLLHGNVALPVVTPAFAWSLGWGTEMGRRSVQEWKERLKLRTAMQLYFSPGVIDHVLAKPGALEPRAAELVILLSDVRNFTNITERFEPRVVYDLLNRVFSAETHSVHTRNGNLEHFFGDCFAAYWGAPEPEPRAAQLALESALEIIARLDALHLELPPELGRWFGYGIAIHRGQALVGNVGGSERLDYMVLGDVMNTTARIESLTKYYGVPILITREIIEKIIPPLPARMIDRVVVKGKSAPVEIWEPAHSRSPADFPILAERYAAAWRNYEEGEFPAAVAAFEALRAEFADRPSQALAARCRELQGTKPPDWSGTYRLDFK